MRNQYIREHRQEYSVKRMCQLLSVTRSGYYAWRPEKRGLREKENLVMVEQIRSEFKTSRQTYGSPRIQVALRRKGVACGRHCGCLTGGAGDWHDLLVHPKKTGPIERPHVMETVLCRY